MKRKIGVESVEELVAQQRIDCSVAGVYCSNGDAIYPSAIAVQCVGRVAGIPAGKKSVINKCQNAESSTFLEWKVKIKSTECGDFDA